MVLLQEKVKMDNVEKVIEGAKHFDEKGLVGFIASFLPGQPIQDVWFKDSLNDTEKTALYKAINMQLLVPLRKAQFLYHDLHMKNIFVLNSGNHLQPKVGLCDMKALHTNLTRSGPDQGLHTLEWFIEDINYGANFAQFAKMGFAFAKDNGPTDKLSWQAMEGSGQELVPVGYMERYVDIVYGPPHPTPTAQEKEWIKSHVVGLTDMAYKR